MQTLSKQGKNESPAAAAGAPGGTGIRSLARFTADLGKTASTVWRWRNLGYLEVVNICGKLYITDEQISRFKQRAAAGEFAKKAVVPRRDRPEPHQP
jgi:hypothetical protein